MDTHATVTDIAPETGEATVKETPQGTQGTESVASETAERAGGEQSTTEGNQVETPGERPRGRTKMDTIKELRMKLRERDQRFDSERSAWKAELEELKGMIASERRGDKPSKTFFEAPEEVLDERITGHLSAMEKRLLQRLDARDSQVQEQTQIRLEASQAAEFIKSRGVNPEDEEDLIEIIHNMRPELYNSMRPMERARYAYLQWKDERGVTDKTTLKNRATTIPASGATPGGQKEWTESGIEQAMKKFQSIPVSRWTPEMHKEFEALDSEIRGAYKANRVKK